LTLKIIVYSSPFVPAEWIAAHGLLPSRLTPRGGEGAALALPPMGVCPYASAFAAAAAGVQDAAGIVMTTTCDQMRRVAEWVEAIAACPVFIMHVPTAVAAVSLYQEEIRRLGRFLQRVGGANPAPEFLSDTMEQFESARSRWRRGNDAAPPGAISVALVGAPLMQRDADIFGMIKKAGGYVALDAAETGERALPRPFNPSSLRQDPVTELACAYFDSITDAFRRPNDLLYHWLGRVIIERGIRGIILHHHAWCDTWQIEAQRMREKLSLPVLALESADDGLARATGRIGAFLETLR
jgi:benzoyl-CoA reductase/2-hydroxyglutaryl-CoA dehydratase subunit BcrC/BadD/HgdB